MYRMATLKLSALALLLLLSTLACGLTARGDDRGASPNLAAGSNTITVSTTEMDFTLSTTQARAGEVTFIVRNDGHAPHTFAIQGNGVNTETALLDTGDRETLKVNLSPGEYTYICTVPGHAMLGMRGTLTVVP